MAKLSCGLTIPGVFEKDGRYYRVKQNKWIGLSRIDEGVTALYRALCEIDPPRPGSISDLIRIYRAAGMDELKPATQTDYHRILTRLDRHFGSMSIGALKPKHCAGHLERRKQAGRGRTRANREMAVLSSVFDYGMRRGWADFNPCRGFRRNKERPRKRHVKDVEFLEVFNASNDSFQDLLAAAYLGAPRQTDIIAWKRAEHLKPEGIVYIESKTGKERTIEWSPALRFFVERALARQPDSEYVFTNTRGQPWTVWAINSEMARHGRPWAFKDLRAKAQTDAPHAILGHGAAMEELYRKARRTKPVR